MLDTEFAPWPSFTAEEAEAVKTVLLSNRVNYWTGREGKSFESEFASYVGAKYAVALSNGTIAIDLALKALDIGQGDEVVVTPRTFLASASCIVNAGATPVFADVDRDSQNITAGSIEDVLTTKSRAVICVHLAGWPCEMDEILELARKRDLAVIEDCAQAHGATYRDRPVGSIGDVAAWSFCQDKIMSTAGEGGMLTTNDREVWSGAWSFKDHGKSHAAVYEGDHSPGFRWLHDSFGTNGRMTEMQSAVGRVQTRRMPEWHQRRLEIANRIWTAAASVPGIRVPEVPGHIEHAAYKCYVFVEPELLGSDWDRDRIMSEINALGVPCFSGSCSEIYLEKAFEKSGLRPIERLPNAKELGETSLMFLCHPTLTQDQVRKTCGVLASVMAKAVRN